MLLRFPISCWFSIIPIISLVTCATFLLLNIFLCVYTWMVLEMSNWAQTSMYILYIYSSKGLIAFLPALFGNFQHDLSMKFHLTAEFPWFFNWNIHFHQFSNQPWCAFCSQFFFYRVASRNRPLHEKTIIDVLRTVMPGVDIFQHSLDPEMRTEWLQCCVSATDAGTFNRCYGDKFYGGF